MKHCSNCRYGRKTKEMWCKCTGDFVNPDNTCDKWEKLMKKCDGCGKEFDGPGLIIGHLKDNPEVDVVLCNECIDRLYREVIKELLKGESDDLDTN